MLELCTPIIYGSPKVAAYHRNVLNNQANFTIINKFNFFTVYQNFFNFQIHSMKFY